MLALVFLCLAFYAGHSLVSLFLPDLLDPGKLMIDENAKWEVLFPRLFIMFPASFAVGVIFTGWVAYFAAYAAQGTNSPMLFGSLAAFAFAIGISALRIFVFKRKPVQFLDYFKEFRAWTKKSAAVSLFLFGVMWFIIWLMTYTFFVADGKFNMGYSIFSDFSVHTALIRSFSTGKNFPTNFPHFPDGTIRYHFMFQFFTGLLEYMGLRMDWGLNLLSILALAGCTALLYTLAVIITRNRLAGCLAILFFFLRSSLSGILFLKSAAPYESVGDFITTITHNANFVGKTPNESWGLWNMNVYANQRHFALGISVLLFVAIAMLPLYNKMRASIARAINEFKSLKLQEQAQKETEQKIQAQQKGQSQNGPKIQGQRDKSQKSQKGDSGDTKRFGEEDLLTSPAKLFKNRQTLIAMREAFFSKDAWVWENVPRMLFVGILTGAMSFYHGSAVIALLGILACIGIFSKHRLEFAVIAAITYAMSQLQAAFFAPGIELAKPQIVLGFIASKKTFQGVSEYLFELTGFCLLAAAIGLAISFKKTFMFFLAAAVPFVVTFTLSLTPDVTVNHKFLMISLALFNIFSAYAIAKLYQSGWNAKWLRVLCKACACAIILLFVSTGILDFFTMLNQDGFGKSARIDLDNSYQTWIRENTDPNAVFIGPWPSLNDVFFAGRREFLGWPYYAWSGGYDTDGRSSIFAELVNTLDEKRFIEIVMDNQISYIAVDHDLLNNSNFRARPDLIVRICEKVFENPEQGLEVYETPYVAESKKQ
ncbi:MAG: hypothetical protein LBT59_03795 [Clostridiales bacterium]|nr:hypothetical protein [Clostridiales bacterium]